MSYDKIIIHLIKKACLDYKKVDIDVDFLKMTSLSCLEKI